MLTEAAILIELAQRLDIVELEIPSLRTGQVLVEVQYSGVCGTQVLEARGWRGADPFLPHCMGHEGSGIVCDIGPGVSKVASGDAVVLSWLKASGMNVPGCTYRWNGRIVNAGGVTTFGRYMVVSENRLTRVPKGIGMREAALLGCAVPTGFGSVINTGALRPGESVVVFGAGGVGLCAIMAAVVSGGYPIIAVDIVRRRLELAQTLGVSHVIDASTGVDVAKAISETVGGIDLAIEATGRPRVMELAFRVLRPQGGRAVIVGNAHFGETVSLDPREFNQGKQLRGTWGGDVQPDIDFPRYGALISSGRAPAERLVEREYRLSEVNEALDDLENGRCARPLINIHPTGS
jgi:S-(hydroxymethyl)glutathione dehydrogenase/alcohol dehydrogenase